MMQQPQQQYNRTSKPPRFKIILLGSAGAGKTSLLRRFVCGTFRDDVCGDVGEMRSATTAIRKKRHHRSTMSTLGADYYVKKIPNPLFGGHMNGCTASLGASCCGCCDVTARDDSINSRIQNRKQGLFNQSHVLVQLWDTRGAEPSLPTYNSSNQVQFNIYQFLSLKPGTTDATITDQNGYHLHRYNNWGTSQKWGQPKSFERCMDLTEPKRRISNIIKCHDTPSFLNDTINFPGSNNGNSPSSNALYNNIDVCMLVYDATSSTSFLRLMSYHEELVRRYYRQEVDQHDCELFEVQQKNKKARKRLPFIVVANKIDLLDDIVDASHPDLFRTHRRSVMGFDTYCGMDEIYEYAAENLPPTTTSCCCNHSSSTCSHQQYSLPPESSPPSKAKSKRHNNINKLSFSLKETAWSSDSHYLRSLQQADDQLSVNRTLVLLWCERNGIHHVEASALDGRGVDFAMEELVRLAVLEKMKEEELNEDALEFNEKAKAVDVNTLTNVHNYLNYHQLFIDVHTLEKNEVDSTAYEDKCALSNGHESTVDQTCSNTPISSLKKPNIDNSQYTFLYEPKYEKKLDLFARYSTKEDKRCALACFR